MNVPVVVLLLAFRGHEVMLVKLYCCDLGGFAIVLANTIRAYTIGAMLLLISVG
jgi:hypothetical protein